MPIQEAQKRALDERNNVQLVQLGIMTSADPSWPARSSLPWLLSAPTRNVYRLLRLLILCQGGYTKVCILDPYGGDGPVDCHLILTSGESLADFSSKAFRNCTVGRLAMSRRRGHVVRAINLVAHASIVVDTLHVHLASEENGQELLEFVGSFAA